MPISTEYTDLQRKAVNLLSYLSVSLTTVEIEKDGKYKLKSGGIVRVFLYIIVTLNTFSKFVYLVFLVFGYFGPVDFIDLICGLLWILMCLEITQELLFFGFKYPLYEVLINLWSLENRIYHKLGKPEEIKKRCYKKNRTTLVFHLGILISGCCLIAVQFLYAPKYSVYTYSAFEEDNFTWLFVFTCHETCFMWQAWTGYLSVVSISSLNAVELSCILDGMTTTLQSLTSEDQEVKHASNSAHTYKIISHSDAYKSYNDGNKATTFNVDEELGNVDIIEVKAANQFNLNSKNKRNHLSASVVQNQFTGKVKVKLLNTLMNPKKVAVGTEYTAHGIIQDYKKLMLASDLLNDWCAYRIVGVHTIGYCQFISDVFMMIQLIMLPEMDMMAVLWFGEDASVCLIMIFRLFTLMSEVAPASETFLRTIQLYLTVQNPMRIRFLKALKSLRLVSLKLGPCPVQPGTVGAAVMMLMNYYLVVALWKSN